MDTFVLLHYGPTFFSKSCFAVREYLIHCHFQTILYFLWLFDFSCTAQSICCTAFCDYFFTATISGVDSMHNYELVLRQIRYRNWYTSATFDRKFRVKCSELNGRYTSNEFNLEVSNNRVKSFFSSSAAEH